MITKRRRKIYVAGPMTNSDPIKFLKNLSEGIHMSAKLVQLGFAPFSPFIDFQYFLSLRYDEKITVDEIKEASMEWLYYSDIVLVIGDYSYSPGTLAEISEANRLEIPVVFDLESLLNYGRKNK